MADPGVAAQGIVGTAAQNLMDEAHASQVLDPTAVKNCHSGGLLASMLYNT
jgi:hypothetical protein